MIEETKSKLLAPLADRGKPSAADIERMRTKIQATLAQEASRAPPSSARLAKWVGLSCVAILVAGVSARRLGGGPSSPPPAMVAAPSVVMSVAAAEPAGPVVRGVPVVSVDSLPVAPPPAQPAPSAPGVKADDTLAREARLLAEAESAFRHGDDVRALGFLAEHEREFPNGALKDERRAERVVVLCHAGRVEQAVREGRAFLQNRGSDPLARRVALSCAGTTDEAP